MRSGGAEPGGQPPGRSYSKRRRRMPGARAESGSIEISGFSMSPSTAKATAMRPSPLPLLMAKKLRAASAAGVAAAVVVKPAKAHRLASAANRPASHPRTTLLVKSATAMKAMTKEMSRTAKPVLSRTRMANAVRAAVDAAVAAAAVAATKPVRTKARSRAKGSLRRLPTTSIRRLSQRLPRP